VTEIRDATISLEHQNSCTCGRCPGGLHRPYTSKPSAALVRPPPISAPPPPSTPSQPVQNPTFAQVVARNSSDSSAALTLVSSETIEVLPPSDSGYGSDPIGPRGRTSIEEVEEILPPTPFSPRSPLLNQHGGIAQYISQADDRGSKVGVALETEPSATSAMSATSATSTDSAPNTPPSTLNSIINSRFPPNPSPHIPPHLAPPKPAMHTFMMGPTKRFSKEYRVHRMEDPHARSDNRIS